MNEINDGWREIDDRAVSGERILLLWKPFGDISEHVELGWFSQSATGWVNTYGKPFSSAPDRYAPLEPFNSHATLLSEIEALKAENERLKAMLPAPRPFEFTSTEKRLLKWLGDADSSSLGECEGTALTVLINRGLAEVGPTPEGKHPHYAQVTLTEDGIAARAALQNGGQSNG
jgi:hypothetical protein